MARAHRRGLSYSSYGRFAVPQQRVRWVRALFVSADRRAPANHHAHEHRFSALHRFIVLG